MRRANFAIVYSESTSTRLVIRDIGPWDRHPTVTNAAEQVVAELHASDLLPAGRQLLYYDSDENLDELKHDGQGRFQGFAPAASQPTSQTGIPR